MADWDYETEFGGVAGIVQPLEKRVYGSKAGLPGDGTYTGTELFLARLTADPLDPGAIADPTKIGKTDF